MGACPTAALQIQVHEIIGKEIFINQLIINQFVPKHTVVHMVGFGQRRIAEEQF